MEHGTIRSVNTFIISYILVYIVSVLVISLDNFSMNTNFTAVAATINNIGPGFDAVGATGNFAGSSDLSKYVFCFDMIAGRLEIFPMMILFIPSLWKRH